MTDHFKHISHITLVKDSEFLVLQRPLTKVNFNAVKDAKLEIFGFEFNFYQDFGYLPGGLSFYIPNNLK